MKRSINLAYTRQPRNPLLDTARFLRDLGMSPEGIEAVLNEMQTGKDEIPPSAPSEPSNPSDIICVICGKPIPDDGPDYYDHENMGHVHDSCLAEWEADEEGRAADFYFDMAGDR